MFKKTKLVLITLFFLFLGLKLALSEQNYYGREKTVSSSAAVVKKTPAGKAASPEISSSQEKTNQEILSKLNQVLSNQERIMAELKIIKVRASRG